MSAESEFDQIPRLMERGRQLELVNDTQFLLIHNLEKNIKDLLVTDATKTHQLSSLEQKFLILREMVDCVNDRVDESNEKMIELDRAAHPGKYWGGGPR